MKKFIIFILLVALAVIFTPWLQPEVDATGQHRATFLVAQRTYISDGQMKAMDVVPFIRNNRVYIPVRYLGRALGIADSDIIWDGTSKSVVICPDGAAIKLTAGSNLLYAGDKKRTMDVRALLEEGRMYIPARWFAEALGYEVKWDEAGRAVLVGPAGSLPEPPGAVSDLPVVGSYENFQSLLAGMQAQSGMLKKMSMKAPLVTEDLAGAAEARNMMSQSAENEAAADYSGTNVQVAGVDEADMVKTDGDYIYLVDENRVVITAACPPEDMKVVNTLEFAENSFSPQEIYVDGRYLVVIGHTQRYREIPGPVPLAESSAKMAAPGIMPPLYRSDTVKALVYDIRDKVNIKQVRELELGGRYVSSRKVGASFYLVANKNIYYTPLREMEGQGQDLKPFYYDPATSGDLVEMDFSGIKCFPGFIEPNYLVVAGINLDRPEEKADVQAFLGSGENIYASPENLYVAVTGHRYDAGTGFGLVPRPVNENVTRIYKFALNGGRLKYHSCGEVPGTILNQFSMDEHEGYFRIATTRGDIWRTNENTSKNNVYVMDQELNITGRLEDIAPGEKIYSARFMGNRGYLVTFRTVDPFFVIDLKDPRHPAILGALKIPGYSDYLHPYDDNHVLGFGKDTIEVGQKDRAGNETGSMA
ncbi:MAG: Secreted protein, partial [Pelotomaculum thermopropionicum]